MSLISARKTPYCALAVFLAVQLHCAVAETVPAPTTPIQTATAGSTIDAFAHAGLLHLGDDVKQLLDRMIAPISSKAERTAALHRLLFDADQLDIVYDLEHTYTAQETYLKRSGNCLAHAALFVAAARHVGLNAYLQNVEVPTEWREGGSLYVVPGHVNAKVFVPTGALTIEFVRIYSATQSKDFKSRRMSDEEAAASYFSNLGAQALQAGELEAAETYLTEATRIYPKLDLSWSNLGVAYRKSGRLAEAEEAYLRALHLNPKNLSVLNNLYSLYLQMDDSKSAARIAEKVEKHQRKNPYLLAQRASEEMSKKDFQAAERLLRKALKIKGDEDRFHKLLGQIYMETGNLQRSAHHLSKAVELAKTEGDRISYMKQLQALKSGIGRAS